MITEKDIHRLAEELWRIANRSGLADPIIVFEHLSYLIFLRLHQSFEGDDYSWYDLMELIRSEEYQLAIDEYQEKWLRFTPNGSNIPPSQFPFDIKTLQQLVMFLNAALDWVPDNTLTEAFYDALLNRAIGNKHGIVPTPHLLASTMAKLLAEFNPIQHSRLNVCDPACGIGSLLASLWNELHTREFEIARLDGFEVMSLFARIAQINMLFRQGSHNWIHNEDSLALPSEYRGRYDYVICNPPFTKKSDWVTEPMWYSMGEYAKRGTRSYQFIELSLALLKIGGHCAIVVPEGLLSSTQRYDVEFRMHLLERYQLNSVVSLPSGFFPGTAMKTSILLLTRPSDGAILAKEVLYYDFEQKAIRLRTDEELWDKLVTLWRTYLYSGTVPDIEGGHAWTVSLEKIIQNECQLGATLYKQSLFPPKKHIDPSRLLYEIFELEKQLHNEMEDLYELHHKIRPDVNDRDTDALEGTAGAEAELSSVLQVLREHFSRQQNLLLDVYMESEKPLAIHEAAKRANRMLGEEMKLGVQEANQMTELFDALGLLESTSSGVMLYPKQFDEDERIIQTHKPVTILLWKKAERLKRS
ncbi:N-6 DNA methylase [Paenibacillus sp. 7124]|uniref:site-specific DNA-methyltransferase (adenine-specific) n=1 Tax=Paenibacillus apii TaxID=1850370 RepID=A0A6M1PN94_9BACL|nr:N-6 DNA methylase [Paenibacillus apii]NGM83948.1 N-6 DNA methylase [Paenibacillus apii]